MRLETQVFYYNLARHSSRLCLKRGLTLWRHSPERVSPLFEQSQLLYRPKTGQYDSDCAAEDAQVIPQRAVLQVEQIVGYLPPVGG